MKLFVHYIICFAISLLLLAILADHVVTRGLHYSTDRNLAVFNDIYSGNIKSDVIILGSSRALLHYNTLVIDSILQCSSYNLGADGQAL